MTHVLDGNNDAIKQVMQQWVVDSPLKGAEVRKGSLCVTQSVYTIIVSTKAAPAPQNKGAVYYNSLLLKLESNTLHKGSCIVSQHQEMTGDLWEHEDKSYSVSHILSPFPFFSLSHNQLSWLIHAHSCPNRWSPDMTKARTEEGRE